MTLFSEASASSMLDHSILQSKIKFLSFEQKLSAGPTASYFLRSIYQGQQKGCLTLTGTQSRMHAAKMLDLAFIGGEDAVKLDLPVPFEGYSLVVNPALT